MPCYCDTPDENDQAEIEKRAKERMYFDGISLLFEEQKNKCKQDKICFVPLPDPNTALCNLCKILTQEQMQGVSAYYYQIKWPHKTLYDWYIKHCEDDLNNN